MSLKWSFAGFAMPFALMGCVMDSPAAPPPTPAPPGQVDLSSCSSDAVQSLVGTNVASVDTSRLSKTVRVIPPGTAVTMDYNPARLNIETDRNGVIVRLTCG